MRIAYLAFLFLAFSFKISWAQNSQRKVVDFDKGWSFNLGEVKDGQSELFNDHTWRKLDLPHDWSIEGKFDKANPATPEGGALPGGIGWYRKTFVLPLTDKNKLTYIDFGGVYQKSEVWINGHSLGFRPNGYISFRYELSPYLNYGTKKNVIAVKVDNSVQPNSRWYSGSGIYRHVALVTTGKIAVDNWGTFVTTTDVDVRMAIVHINTTVNNKAGKQNVTVSNTLVNAAGKVLGTSHQKVLLNDAQANVTQQITVNNPELWSVSKPYLYSVITKIYKDKVLLDEYKTPIGIRYFNFDADKGFTLNGKALKILGVCDHHDLGSLGSAVNYRALQRQLEILKGMGCNAIRTSHNPPAVELLDLADKMGFIVMDEAFDCWEWGKVNHDYHIYFKEWHKRDLEDQILRDRNHPSIFIWSIGNEIPQQTDSSAYRITKDLAGIVRGLDKTRPLVTANDRPDTTNKIIKSNLLELTGYNYHQWDYESFHKRYPGKIFIGTETSSALETRGFYDMPSDSIRRWPLNKKQTDAGKTMNKDFQVSAYDNVSAPWGSTHEETWRLIKKHDYLSGMFIWTGFDYLGEPTPYSWPARSSFFGIVDLAGFPKDVYYMYQAEWTDKTVLHVFPHWNWEPGKVVDLWAYYNHADEVELFLNGKSLGTKTKKGDDLHVMWRVSFEPGTIKAVSRKDGKVVATQIINTAGAPAKIALSADRSTLHADGKDLSFITAKILDGKGNLVPNADNRIEFYVNGEAVIAATDNGDPISHESFQSKSRNAFNGLALAIIKAKYKAGKVVVTAKSAGLQTASVTLLLK